MSIYVDKTKRLVMKQKFTVLQTFPKPPDKKVLVNGLKDDLGLL